VEGMGKVLKIVAISIILALCVFTVFQAYALQHKLDEYIMLTREQFDLLAIFSGAGLVALLRFNFFN